MLQDTLKAIVPISQSWLEKARHRCDQLIKPVGSLGKLESYYAQLSAVQQTLSPRADKRAVIIFSADHGVIVEGVAVCPQSVTLQQTENFVRGVTGVCAIAKQAGARIYPVDIAVNTDVTIAGVIDRKIARGSNNIAVGPAMTREQAVRAIEVGIELAHMAVDDGHNILATGEMGICNTTPSAAIVAALAGLDAELVTGVGANLDPAGVANKVAVVRRAIQVNRPDVDDAIDIVSKIGGYEIAAMMGAYLGAAQRGVVIVVDGFIATASALLAVKLNPHVKDYLIASHMSGEKGARVANDLLGLSPALDMDLRLGEGSGAALMFNLIEAACYMGIEMITFEEAGIGVV